MNLLDQINRFCKLASGDPSLLLRTAIETMDRETYLIFLDALEEQMPKVRESILKKSLRTTLEVLSHPFPDILENAFPGSINIKVPNFLQIENILFKNKDIAEVGYSKYSFYFDASVIYFYDITEINGTKTVRLENTKDHGVVGALNGNEFPIPNAIPIFYEFKEKALSDMEKLRHLFS